MVFAQANEILFILKLISLYTNLSDDVFKLLVYLNIGNPMSKSKKATLWSGLLCVAMLLISSAQAAMVGTPEILTDTNRTTLLKKLERNDVQQQLVEMGVDPQSAIKRVENMSDEEIAEINGQLDSLPAGAGLSNLELLLLILLIVLLV
jgi:hypothetical protein